MSSPHHHARRHLHHPHQLGARAADGVATAMGSWWFLGIQSGFIAVWMVLNLAAWMHHWDPYPWILLNLLFSTQAAYAAPVILMSQNRAAARDRARDDLEAHEVDLLVQDIAYMRAINDQQLEILKILHDLQRQAKGTL